MVRHDSMKKVPTFPGVDKDMATMGRGRSQYALQIPVYSNLVSGETWVNRTTLSQLPMDACSPLPLHPLLLAAFVQRGIKTVARRLDYSKGFHALRRD